MAYPAPYETACVHKWNFNQAGSGNVSDGVGVLTCTISGATSTAVGYNGADDYVFDGTNDSGDIGTGHIINSGAFTIEIVCSLHVIATAYMIFTRFSYPSSKYYGWDFSTYNSSVYFESYSNNTALFTANTTKTNWTADKVYHFFVTGDPAGGANNYKIYWMNGTTPTLDGQATYAGSPNESQATDHTYVGRWNGSGYYYGGGMYLIRLHNAVLTTAQMTQNYEAESWRYGDTYVAMSVPGSHTEPGTVTTYIQQSATVTMPVPGSSTAPAAITPKVYPTMTVPGSTTAPAAITPKVYPTMTVPGTTTAPAAITPKVYPTMTVPDATATPGAVFAYLEQSKTVVLSCPDATADVGLATPNIEIIMPCPECTADDGGEVVIGVTITLTAPDVTADAGILTTQITIYALPSECDISLEWPLVISGFAEYPETETVETIEYADTETSTINEWPDSTVFEEEWSKRCT